MTPDQQIATRATASARLREQLGHPVIDGDGHVLEPLALFADFVRDHGRTDLVEQASTFKAGLEYFRMRRETSVEDRRRLGMYPAFWITVGDAEYFATVTAPGRYHQRIADAGIDYSILYPTMGSHMPTLAAEDERRSLCHLYNEFMAELYGPYRDRMTVAALIPMDTPEEAIVELTHAKAVGAKIALIPSYVRRPLPGQTATWSERGAVGGASTWIDTFGLDSAYDYDPVWAKAIELRLPLAAHSAGMGFTDRSSPTNFMYNHCGHFAAAGEALAKSLFFGGVTTRFPELRVVLLEGGVDGGVRLLVDLVGRWRKRNGQVIGHLNPANLDRAVVAELVAASDPRLGRYSPDQLIDPWGDPADWRDDFAAVGAATESELCDRFCTNFSFGCEADDPLVGVAWDRRVVPPGARVPAIMGSDIGHWDVPEFDSALEEAYELVEHEILDTAQLREFVFTNAVHCYGGLNPDFFRGTTIETAADAELRAAT